MEPMTKGERTRRRALEVTAQLVVSGGVEAVTHAAVAELVPCTRTLVYRYFPSRESLLGGILERVGERYQERFDMAEVKEDFRRRLHARRGAMPAESRSFQERFWRPEDWNEESLTFNLAAVILIRVVLLGGTIGGQPISDRHLLTPLFVSGPLRDLGLNRMQADLVVDAMLSALYHVLRAALAGAITREDAIELQFRMISGALQTVAASTPTRLG
jgi:AcrR family transcriptional regulator